MTGRTSRWVLITAVAAAGCTAHAAVPAGADGPVGPQISDSVAVTTPSAPPSAAPSSSLTAAPSGVYRMAAGGALLPAEAITPGAADAGLTAAQLCRAGYVSAAKALQFGTKLQVFTDYGLAWAERRKYRLDDLIPLSLGGLPEHLNLWPMPTAGPHGALEKDGVETRLKQLVCAKELTLGEAQQALATDWYAAGLRYGMATPVPTEVTWSSCTTAGARAVDKYAKALSCGPLLSGKLAWLLSATTPNLAVTPAAKPQASPNQNVSPTSPGKPGAKRTPRATTPVTGPPGVSSPRPRPPVQTTPPSAWFTPPVAAPGLPPPAG